MEWRANEQLRSSFLGREAEARYQQHTIIEARLQQELATARRAIGGGKGSLTDVLAETEEKLAAANARADALQKKLDEIGRIIELDHKGFRPKWLRAIVRIVGETKS